VSWRERRSNVLSYPPFELTRIGAFSPSEAAMSQRLLKFEAAAGE
jgi:hypothetical protein